MCYPPTLYLVLYNQNFLVKPIDKDVELWYNTTGSRLLITNQGGDRIVKPL